MGMGMERTPHLVAVEQRDSQVAELPISVVLAEDHPLMLRSLRRLLEADGRDSDRGRGERPR